MSKATQIKTPRANQPLGLGADSIGPAKPANDGSDVSKIYPPAPEAVAHGSLKAVLGDAVDLNFANGLISQIKAACMQDSSFDQMAFDFTFSVIKDNKPRDQNETMLAAQMAAVHRITMTMTNILANSNDVYQTELAARLFMNLTKTFTAQLETLTRYRAGGGHQVTVQNVSVREGGQAIVGNVTHNPVNRSTDKSAGSPLAIADAKAIPMPFMEKSKPYAEIANENAPDKAAAAPLVSTHAKAPPPPPPLMDDRKERIAVRTRVRPNK